MQLKCLLKCLDTSYDISKIHGANLKLNWHNAHREKVEVENNRQTFFKRSEACMAEAGGYFCNDANHPNRYGHDPSYGSYTQPASTAGRTGA